MTRTELPNTSARAEWLFAGIIDGSLHHWGHVLPVDGGIGDHDHADLDRHGQFQTTTSPVDRLRPCSQSSF